jgi:hypothetical protein
VGVFAWQATSTRASLVEASDQAELLQDQLVSGDTTGAQQTLRDLQASAEDARSSSDGVLWTAGSWVPWLGRNVAAVRTVAAEIDRVATQAAPPVVDLAAQLGAKTFSPADGTVDLESVERAAPAIARAREVLEESRRRLRDVAPDSLLAPLRAPVGTVKSKVSTTFALADDVDLAARLLPELLGGAGTRRYLLLNQNNAETRPTGGIAGSYAVITAKKGTVTLGTQGSIREMPPFDRPVVELDDDERSVFPSTIATDIRDVNITPDFPRSASIARTMVERTFDIEIDGVVTIDPVAISYLLAGTGPVDLGSGIVLDQDNIVTALLHTVYVRVRDSDAQDDLFDLANRKIFDAFAAGQGDAAVVLRAFVRGVQENRIAFWAARDDEQRSVAATDLGGALTADDGATAHLGVYLSDAAAGKMEYFLEHDSTLAATSCLDGDRQVLTATTDLTSNAPANAGSLSPFVTGTGDFVRRGWMRLNVRLFAPFGGTFTSVRLDGEPISISSTSYEGRGVTRVEVLLRPGQTRTLVANATSGPGQSGRPVLTTTPGVASARNDVQVPSACR